MIKGAYSVFTTILEIFLIVAVFAYAIDEAGTIQRKILSCLLTSAFFVLLYFGFVGNGLLLLGAVAALGVNFKWVAINPSSSGRSSRSRQRTP